MNLSSMILMDRNVMRPQMRFLPIPSIASISWGLRLEKTSSTAAPAFFTDRASGKRLRKGVPWILSVLCGQFPPSLVSDNYVAMLINQKSGDR